jgi:hypothetical protein
MAHAPAGLTVLATELLLLLEMAQQWHLGSDQ